MADETVLSLTSSETPKTGFLATRLIFILNIRTDSHAQKIVSQDQTAFLNEQSDLSLHFLSFQSYLLHTA